MDSKSRATIFAIRSAVCLEYGGKELQNAVEYAKKACALDSENAYWNYSRSVVMTAQRQYLNTNKSCPTDAEFDAIQYAIILSNEPNPYFNYHRMNLVYNKILYYYHLQKNNNDKKYLERKKIDFKNVVQMIK